MLVTSTSVHLFRIVLSDRNFAPTLYMTIGASRPLQYTIRRNIDKFFAIIALMSVR